MNKSLYHPDVDKTYFYDCIRFNGKYYAGTIKDGIARLYDDPFNPTKTTLVVKVKNMEHACIKDGGDTEVLVLQGEIISQ